MEKSGAVDRMGVKIGRDVDVANPEDLCPEAVAYAFDQLTRTKRRCWFQNCDSEPS